MVTWLKETKSTLYLVSTLFYKEPINSYYFLNCNNAKIIQQDKLQNSAEKKKCIFA